MDNKTKRELFQEIEQALGTVKFGSVEIYVSDDRVTQITVRKITKTSIDINEPQEISQTRNGEFSRRSNQWSARRTPAFLS